MFMKKITYFLLFLVIYCWQGNAQTPCTPVMAPFLEDFSSSSTPACWTESGDSSWEYSLNTPAYAAANLSDHTLGGGTNYLVMDGSDNGDGDISTITSPFVNVSGLTTPALRFYVFSDNVDDSAINILDVEFYDGSSWNTVLNQTTLLGSNWEEFLFDLSTYTITGDVQIRFTVTGNANGGFTYYNDIVIDDVSLIELPTCLKPASVQNTATTTSTADFSWGTEATATTGYNWIVMNVGDSPITGTPVDSGSVTTGTTTAQATGLTAGTNYDFYVQSDCGGGDLSDWSNVANFATNCGALTVSVCQNFDTTPVGSTSNPSLPNCWNFIDSGTGYGYTRAFTPHSGANSFYMYNSSDATGDYILVTPEIINVTDGTNRVNFWVDGTTSQELIVGTMTDPTDAMTFTSIQTITLATSSYENYTINIPVGTDSYVAFKHGQTGTFDAYYLDDICVEAIPSCFVPSNVQNLAVTDVTGDFSWDSESTATVGYNWVVMANGDDPTVDAPVTSGSVTTGTTTVQVTGLTAQTDYDFYVQSDCGVTNGLSNWSMKVDFQTSCAPLIAPFTENFDSGSIPACWSQDSNNDWEFDGTISWNTSGCSNTPADHTTGSGEFAAVDFTNTAPGTSVILEMPLIDVSSLTVPILRFYMFFCSTGYTPPNEMFVEAFDGTVWNQIALIDTGSASWEEFNYDLSTFTNGNLMQIRFRVEESTSSSSFYGDMAIDDVSIIEQPTCLKPSNVQNTTVSDITADFSWDAEPNATVGYNWAVMADGDDPTVDTPITSGSVATGTTTAQATGLTADTDYDFYVQTDCGVTDGLSVWSSVVNFTTNCTAFSIPFCENFDSTPTGTTTNPSTPNCWNFVDSGSGYGYTRAFTPNSGPNSFYIYNGSDSTGDYILVSPPISNVSDGNNRVNFWVDGVSGQDLIVGTMSNPTDASTFTAIQTVTLATSVYEEYTINIPVGTDNFIAFKHGQTGTFDSYYLDDICIEAKPSCESPSNLLVTNLGDTTADFSWDAVANASSGYNWAVMADGDDPTVDTPVDSGSVAAGTTTAQATGLTSETDYDFYVQADCGTTDGLSVWEGPINITTLCAAYIVTPTNPFEEDFTAASTPTCWSESGDTSWEYSTSTPAYAAAGLADHTSGGGTLYAVMDGSDNGDGETSTLTTQLMDISALTSPALTFYVFSDNTNDAAINILDVEFYDGSNWNTVLNQTALLGANWVEFNFDLTSYTITGNVQVRFTVTGNSNGGSTFHNDIVIDDVSVYEFSCATPTNVMVSNITTTSADFNWTASADETNGYEYIVMLDGDTPGVDPEVTTGTVNTGVTMVTIGSLSPGVDYDFYVRTICSLSGPWSPVADFTTALPPCDLPTGITNTLVTFTTADFSWTASADETNGYIWLIMADGDDPLIDTPLFNGTVGTGVTTLTVNGLTPATAYDFYIQTDCGGGTVSILSNKVDFMTDNFPCTPPASVSNNAITGTTAKLTWQTNGLETGGYNWVLMADGDDPTTDTPLFNGSVGT